MSSKQKLTILEVTRRQGISSKTGRPYDMRIADCILWQTTSEGDDSVVGLITLPDVLKDSGEGEYLAEFAFGRSFEGQLVPRIVALHPYVSDARPTATPKATCGPPGKTSPSRRWGARPCSPISPDFVRQRFARFTVQEFGTTA
ncbi:hypothetical protein [Pandoraea soli]|uniref:Cellulose synthase n=1 Tax=Pandoraea soli TaxID=2508293 RepID=A0ABY6WAJ5_9BURK|nr:cellulose synthase [Pandoraea soli]